MPTPRIWDGGAWVDKTSKADYAYWDGAAWTEPTDVRVWDGAAWTSIFTAIPPGSGILLRASNTATATAASSLNVTIPGAVQAGDLLVLLVGQVANATTLFNAISGWSKEGEQRAGSAAFTVGVYTRLAQAGDAGSTVTVTSVSTAHVSGIIRAYSGVHQATPLDTAVAFDNTDVAATSYTAPAVTVATAGAMLVTFYGIPTSSGTSLSATDWAGDTGTSNEVAACTAGSGNNAAIASYEMLAPGTGSQGPFAATTTQSRRWATATVTIRPV